MKNFDLNPKVITELKKKSLTGGLITIVFVSLILIYIILFFKNETTHDFYDLVVDDSVVSPAGSQDTGSADGLAATGGGMATSQSGSGNDILNAKISKNYIYIDLDFSFPLVPCDEVEMDSIDAIGKMYDRSIIQHDIFKTKIIKDKNGNVQTDTKEKSQKYDIHQDTAIITLNDSSIAEQILKNQGSSQKNADKEEGCRFHGTLKVPKAPGSFRFGISRQASNSLASILSAFFGTRIELGEEQKKRKGPDLSHDIQKLSFGPMIPDMVNPLDGQTRKQKEGSNRPGIFQYYVKIVPTEFRIRKGKWFESLFDLLTLNRHNENEKEETDEVINTYQYSVTEHFYEISVDNLDISAPGVYIFYQMSPLKMVITRAQESNLTYSASMFAVIGGMFKVMDLLSKFIYSLTAIS